MYQDLYFEWDQKKDVLSRKKHGIAFEEAATVFRNEEAIVFYDTDHSLTEERFLIVGFSRKARLLTVVFCRRKQGKAIRIISARKTTAKERKMYQRIKEGQVS